MLVFLTAYSSCARNLRLRDSGLFYSSLLRRIRLQIFYRNRAGTRFGTAFHKSVLEKLARFGWLEKAYTVRGGKRRYYQISDPERLGESIKKWNLN